MRSHQIRDTSSMAAIAQSTSELPSGSTRTPMKSARAAATRQLAASSRMDRLRKRSDTAAAAETGMAPTARLSIFETGSEARKDLRNALWNKPYPRAANATQQDRTRAELPLRNVGQFVDLKQVLRAASVSAQPLFAFRQSLAGTMVRGVA